MQCLSVYESSGLLYQLIPFDYYFYWKGAYNRVKVLHISHIYKYVCHSLKESFEDFYV